MDGHVDIDDIVEHKLMPVPKLPGRGCPPKPQMQYRVRFRHHTDPEEDWWFTKEELMKTAPQIISNTTAKLLEENNQAIQQVTLNLNSCKLQENTELLVKVRDNILAILKGLKGVPGIMKEMPPLPPLGQLSDRQSQLNRLLVNC
ncbi:hypothetical protein CBR_g3303 [Chara braunii]|uniref:Uncharacterized protein n=1 Tax=Chara braunii TaxID=69332 RepID=A0A388KFM3_CHABU|nr:hypothetical protein CBR_g3303 [Chara braunii]|eukprot:GBG68763.1 hypothetical protein CBR_g3303 [Chara braunii]